MKNPSTIILTKLSLAALLLLPSLAIADMEELIKLQREQIELQKQDYLDRQMIQSNMTIYGKPSPFMKDPVQPDISAEIEEAARNLQYQAQIDADRKADEYYPER